MDKPATTRRDFLTTSAALAGTAAATALAPSTAHAIPMVPTPSRTAPFRVGKWLPSDQQHLNLWLASLKDDVEKAPKPLQPVIQEFKDLIENDPQIFMYFHQMFQQLPGSPDYKVDPTGQPQAENYLTMLRMINHILDTAPEYNKTGLVGFPINAILDWPMGTPGGFAAFLNDKVNAQIKKVLDAWGRYLTSPDSAYVLNKNPKSGWLGADAMAAMPGFADDYICDPKAEHYGFKSWDDFFTRQFRPGRRPVTAPDDNSIVNNACESAPYKIARDVKAVSQFWLKGQPYALQYMFANDPIYSTFVGGTVYQAFLSATSYHRWHSPVNGTVVRAWNIEGTYYSETPAVFFDPAAPNESQGYITEVAARAVILIEADNPDIGLMAFLAIGMAEVSSCDVTVKPGQHVKKGQEIGMFHFGGSTHCLIFRPGVNVEFDLGGQTPGLSATNIKINSTIAKVMKK